MLAMSTCQLEHKCRQGIVPLTMIAQYDISCDQHNVDLLLQQLPFIGIYTVVSKANPKTIHSCKIVMCKTSQHKFSSCLSFCCDVIWTDPSGPRIRESLSSEQLCKT